MNPPASAPTKIAHAGTAGNPQPPPCEAPASQRNHPMPQGDKTSYTTKQKRQAAHIEKSYEKKGVSERTAEKRAWATVNKQDGGGKKK